MNKNCPFCSPDEERVIFRDQGVCALWDAYPASPGHALLIPERHFGSWFEAQVDEQLAILRGLERCKKEIEHQFSPTGFNIGINIGAAAGQTVFHLHVHLIPRYDDDVPDPRGGVRHVIPDRGNYLKRGSAPLINIESRSNVLVGGPDDPLLPHLQQGLDECMSADFAVAFILKTGVGLLRNYVNDLLQRGGRVRIVTGDYLGATDPDALLQLLDLQGDLQLRVYQTTDSSFHPKTYLFHNAQNGSIAYIGSSNFSKTALQEGIEWNYRLLSESAGADFDDLCRAFEELFIHPHTVECDFDWVAEYRKHRQPLSQEKIAEVVAEAPVAPPDPHQVQVQALAALAATREKGNRAGLVVLATGLGKTWLSAFDSNDTAFSRVLFVAHREEILSQAMQTFRRIRPTAQLGRYTGHEKTIDADVLFASIQTLGRAKHLNRFDRTAFDYIIIDEFHHAAANSYRKLIDYFTPQFLLGLTATPDRTDGADLLGLCQENLVYRKDFIAGIELGLLCPFNYYGVPDDVDYDNIPWRSSRFDEEELTRAVATQKRAENVLEQYRDKAGQRTLSFCCSQRHADFMAEYFRDNGVAAVAVHSGNKSAPRSSAIEALSEGRLDVVFAVDIFNEGLDLPAIDTVIMLRPTESSVIWLQQFGRGLRVADNKTALRVIDYIGNHRTFLVKVRAMLSSWVEKCTSDAEIAAALRLLERGDTTLPSGCGVTYDLRSIDIIKEMLRVRPEDDAYVGFFDDWRERHGTRPTALQMYHAGYNPRAVRRSHGSWASFLKAMNVLSQNEMGAVTIAGDFLAAIETTEMTRSYKMLTLLSMLNADCLPGKMDIESLAKELKILAEKNSRLKNELLDVIDNPKNLQRKIEKNPIAAWIGGKGTGKKQYFSYDNLEFKFVKRVPTECRESLQSLIRELADWRLAEYLDRGAVEEQSAFTCKVSHSSGRPILFLPDRNRVSGIPSGWTKVLVDSQQRVANFVKVAVNVLREHDQASENLLPNVLIKWFGADAGKPGTTFQVAFDPAEDGFEMRPITDVVKADRSVQCWHQYMREEIPPLYGYEFNAGAWQQGFLWKKPNVFLLVTLDKKQHNKEHRYEDQFLSPTQFQWQSQNRTTQSSKHGMLIRNHVQENASVQLFVRREKVVNNKAAPFIYCGQLEFQSWEGEKPITVQWRLREAVPKWLWENFNIKEQS